MDGIKPVYFDPETVALLRETLDDAWDCLRPEQQATMLKTTLAVRILESAGHGERDRERLRDAALMAEPMRQWATVTAKHFPVENLAETGT
jgi:hypothetical protein